MWTKKVNTVVLILSICCVLSACGSKSGVGDNPDTALPETEEMETPNVDSAMGGELLLEKGISEYQYAAGEMKKYEEPIRLTFGRNMDLNASNWLEMAEQGEPIEDNRWIRYFRDTLNIECEYGLTNANLGDYNQQILLSMASGELPDVFHVFDQSMIEQLAEAGAILDLTDIYQENANETLGNLVESEGTDIYSTGMYDGRLYAIPQKMPSTNSYNHCWVRRDWLEEQNLALPETMDDVKNIAQVFMEKYNDNIGLMFSNSYMYEYEGIFWAFGGKQNKDRNQWVELEDGTLGFAEIQEEMKGGLRWLNDMYEAGLINAEWSTEDTWQALANYVATNRCGIFFGPHWYGFSLQSYGETMDESADWVACGLPAGTEGYEPLIPANNTVDGWICVNSACEHPEAVVHMLNAYVENLFGENNQFVDYFACELDGSLWKASPIWSLSATVDLDPCNNMAANYDEESGNMNEAGLEGAGKTYWEYIQNGMSAYQYMFGPIDSCFCFVDDTYPDSLLWNKYLGGPTQTQNDRWSSMQELIDTYYLKMINGEIDIDSGFDQMVEEWNALGGTAVTEEINAASVSNS